MKNFKYVLLLIIIVTPLLAGNPVSVPIYDPIYHYLDRLETLGILDNILDGVKPFDREHIADLLREIDLKREQLTRIDREKLDNYLLDYRYELKSGEKYAQIKDVVNPAIAIDKTTNGADGGEILEGSTVKWR